MAWQTPKVDWTADNLVSKDDFNRIEGNTLDLKENKVDKETGKSLMTDAERTKLAGMSGVPKGLISMWSGLISAIPNGWALCNGQNGTPNLTDRFIMGAKTDATINKTGGKNEVTLTVGQMPSHNHSGSTNSAGSHKHNYYHGSSGAGGSYSGIQAYEQNKADLVAATDTTGSHTHTISIGNKGSGQAHENRPAYYTLAFIMKV